MPMKKPVNDQLTKFIIYETHRDVDRRRIRLDSQTLNLPADANVGIDVAPDGSGWVQLSFPAGRVQVIEAGKRLVARRPKPKHVPSAETPGVEPAEKFEKSATEAVEEAE